MEEKNILKSVVAGHDKLHTLFVSKPIKIPNIRVIVDDASDHIGFNEIFSQLEENKEFINGINIPNNRMHYTLLFVAFCRDFLLQANNNTFHFITKMLELGANPYKMKEENDKKSNFDPWRPYYPNPRDIWSSSEGKAEMNLVAMVSSFFIDLIEI